MQRRGERVGKLEMRELYTGRATVRNVEGEQWIGKSLEKEIHEHRKQ